MDEGKRGSRNNQQVGKIMCFIIQRECHCCQKMINTGDFFHCENCWNEHHNGLKHKDWEDEETFRKKHGETQKHWKLIAKKSLEEKEN